MKNKPYPQSYFEDILGQKFGRLTVVKFLRRTKDKNNGTKVEYLCKCDCGNECIATRTFLKGKRYHSCGCWLKERTQLYLEKQEEKYKDLIGERFGKLVVVKLMPREKDEKGFYVRNKKGELFPVKYLCHCDCGNDTIIRRGDLLHNSTRSCGCLHKDCLFKGRGRPKAPVCSHQKTICQFNQSGCCWDCPPKIWEKCPNHCPINPAQCKEYRD